MEAIENNGVMPGDRVKEVTSSLVLSPGGFAGPVYGDGNDDEMTDALTRIAVFMCLKRCGTNRIAATAT